MTRRASRPLSTGRLRACPSRRRRGVGYVWFCVVGVPLFMLAGAMAVDLSHVIVAHRQVSLAAEAAAQAGSFQIQNGHLVPELAVDVTTRTFAQEMFPSSDPGEDVTATGAVADNSGMFGVNVSDVNVVLLSGDAVSVTVTYQLDQQIFGGFFGLLGPTTYSASAEAFLCNSTVNGPTSGHCSLPTD